MKKIFTLACLVFSSFALHAQCNTATWLECSQMLAGRTISSTSSFSIANYNNCPTNSGNNFQGRDDVYQFVLDKQTEVTIRLNPNYNGYDGNLGLFLLNNCSPVNCIAAEDGLGNQPVINALLAAGQYYVVVENMNPGSVTYDIELNCGCNCSPEYFGLQYGEQRLCETFEQYNINDNITANSAVRWKKWSTTSDDAVITQAGGSQQLRVRSATNYEPDVWMNLFNPSGASVTSGRYRLSFTMTVAPDKVGIYHIHHAAPNVNGNASNKAYKVTFYPAGTGSLTLGTMPSTAAYFTFTVGAPTDVMQIIDIDNNLAELWINHEFVYSWPFNIGSPSNSNALAILNFDAYPSTLNNQALDYTIDDICFTSTASGTTTLCDIVNPFSEETCIENGQSYETAISAACDLYDVEMESQPCPTPCDNATWLECSQTLINQDFQSISNFSLPDYEGCFGLSNDIFQTEDRVYKFELKEETEVTITVKSINDENLAVFILDNCAPANCINLSTDPSGYHSLTDVFQPGQYYIVVEDQSFGDIFFKQFNVTLSCGCSCGNITGVPLHCEGFESFLPDELLSANSNRWHTWNSVLDDVPVLDNSGNQSIRIANSGTIEPDIWMNLFPASNIPVLDGRYRLSFDLTVAEGNAASYYVHHTAPNDNGTGQNIAYRVVFNSDGSGKLILGNPTNPPSASFGYVPGVSTNVMQMLDLDHKLAELWINHEFVYSWDFTIGVATSNALADINFDAHPASLGGQDFDYTIDNLCFYTGFNYWTPNCFGFPLSVQTCLKNGEQYPTAQAPTCLLYDLNFESIECQHVCDYGGTMIYRGEIYSGSLDISDRASPLLKFDDCIRAAYDPPVPEIVSAGTTMPKSFYSDIYVFYNESGGPMYFHFNNNGNPTTKCFVYSCYYGLPIFQSQSDTATAARSEFCVREPHCYGEIFPGDSTYAISNSCSDFYYIIVTGAEGSSYSGLSVTPSGPCPRNPPLIACGQTLLNQAITGAANSTFSTVGANGKAYDHCYTGLRNYSGAEKVYKFVLDEPKSVTITLTASSNPSIVPMGFFVYNFICGLVCMDYAENTTSDPTAVRSLLLGEGTYYIVVDKATTAGGNGFSLSLDCDDFTSFPDITRVVESIYDFCPPDPDVLHEVVIHSNAHNFAPDDKIMFRYLNGDGYYLTNPNLTEIWGPSTQTNRTIPLLGDNTLDEKCSYAIGDTFLITVFQTENGQNRYTEYLADYMPVSPGVTATNTFEYLGKSFITNLRELEGSKNFMLNPTEFSVTDTTASSFELKITTDNEETWKVVKLLPADWLTLDDTLGIGQEEVNISFDTNFTEIRRTAFLLFSLSSNPTFYRKPIKITQKGKCNPNPVLSVSATPQVLCGPGTAVLTANVAPGMDNMFTYKWSTGQTGKSIPVYTDVTRPYTVTITNIDCFVTKTATATVTVRALPAQPINPVNRTICQGSPLTQPLAVSLPTGTNQIINWYGQPMGGSILFGGASTTTYAPSVLQTDTFYAETKNTQNMCVSAQRTPVVLTVNPVPSLSLSNDPLCAPDRSYSLSASTDNNNGAYITANIGTVALANGVYTISQIPNGATVIVTAQYSGNNTCSQSDTITHSCDCPPIEMPISTQESPFIVCQNDVIPDLEVIVNPGLKVYWYGTSSGGNPLPGGSDTPLFHASSTGTYYAEARNPLNSCSSERLAISLEIIPAPVLSFIDTVCHINLMTGSTYTARFTSSAPDPIALVGQLSGPVNGIYTLQNVPVGTDIQLFAGAGIGCVSDFLIESPQCACPPIAPPSIPVNVILCADETITPLRVTPTPGYAVDWFSQASSGAALQNGMNTPLFSPALPGLYYAGARDAVTGCRSAARTQVQFQINELPLITLDSTVCEPVTERYGIYFHSNGDVVSTSLGLPLSSGNGGYYLQNISAGTAVNLNAIFTSTGCDQSQIVTEEGCFCPPMAAPVSSGDKTICAGDDYPVLHVTVGPGQYALWYNAANQLLAEGNEFTPQEGGTYLVRPIDTMTHCVGNVTVEVSLSVRQPPVVYAGTDQTICAQHNVYLSGSIQGASSGIWTSSISGGVFVPNNSINAAYYYLLQLVPSDYNLILTSSGAQTPCAERSDTIVVHVNPLPTFSIDMASFYCSPNRQTGYVVFSSNATSISTDAPYDIIPIGPQLYRLTITDIADYNTFTINLIDGNCLKPVSIQENFFNCDCTQNLLPPSLPDSVNYCTGDILPVLQPSVAPGLILKWYELPFSGDPLFTGNVFPVPGPDYYYVETYDSISNCSSPRRLVTVSEHPSPIAFAGQDTTICPGTLITLIAELSSIGEIYQWSSALEADPSTHVAPTQNTTYTLTVVSAFGCSSTDAVQVSVWPAVSGMIEQLIGIQCHGDLTGSLIYHPSGENPDYEYQWNTKATSDQINELGAGDYSVTVTDDHNCRDTAFYEIIEPVGIVLLNSMIVYDTSECVGSIMIEMGGGVGPPYTYTWDWITSAGQTYLEAFDNLDFVEGLLEGIYVVDVQDPNGCVVSPSFSVTPCTTPVEEADLRAFIHVSPNPTTGLLHVKMGLPFDQKVDLTVSDLLGRQLIREQTQVSGARDVIMDLSDLPAAMYLLTVQLENLSTTYKISLQK